MRFLCLQSPLVFHRKLRQELTLCIILYCIVYVISYRHKAKPISRHVCRFNTVPANYVESPCYFQHFALQLVEIYTSVKIRPLTSYRKPRRNPWQTLKSTSTFVQSQADFFIGSAYFLLLSQMLCGAFALTIFSCEPSLMQITILNQNGNHAKTYPACNNWKYCTVLRSWAFSAGDFENYWSVRCPRLTIAATATCWCTGTRAGTSSTHVMCNLLMSP